MSAPQAVNPQYLGSSRSSPRENENPLVTFWKTQVVAPEYRADNITILRAAALFIAGVAFFRSDLGNVIVPAF